MNRYAHVTAMAARVLGPRMIVACAWCKRVLGSKPCAPNQDGETSHDICPECRAKWGKP